METKDDVYVTEYHGIERFTKAWLRNKFGKRTIYSLKPSGYGYSKQYKNRKYKIIDNGNKLIFELDVIEKIAIRDSKDEHILDKDKNIQYETKVTHDEELVAFKVGKRIIGNAARFKYEIGLNSSITPPQSVFIKMGIPMLPFNVFNEAKLDVSKAKIIQHTGEENVLAPKQSWSKDSGRYLDEWIHKTIHCKVDDKYSLLINPSKCSNKESTIGKYYNKDGNLCTKKGYCCNGHQVLIKKNLTKRHFIGAMLIEVDNRQFLFDIDRNEIKHYRFNPFLVELPKKVKTVKEAYDALIPKEVKDSKKKNILRQGEWFFIPVNFNQINESELSMFKKFHKECSAIGWTEREQYEKMCKQKNPKFKKAKCGRWNIQWMIRINKEGFTRRYYKITNKGVVGEWFADGGSLQAGPNRPNTVKTMVIIGKNTFVKGLVRHTGREHEDLMLKTWCKPVPNTAIKSFTISGDVD